MPMKWEPNQHSDLYILLRNIKNVGNDDFGYDFGHVIQLLCALLDNLQQWALDAEIEEVAPAFNDPQRAFLLRLAKAANAMTDKEIEENDE